MHVRGPTLLALCGRVQWLACCACSGWPVVRLDRGPTHHRHKHMSAVILGDFRIMKSVCGCACCPWQAHAVQARPRFQLGSAWS
jgi:hypothetical protein